jgi:hypothetical protein
LITYFFKKAQALSGKKRTRGIRAGSANGGPAAPRKDLRGVFPEKNRFRSLQNGN